MLLIKCPASISLATIALPTLHSEPHCPGNIASLPFHLVQRARIIVPVVINHNRRACRYAAPWKLSDLNAFAPLIIQAKETQSPSRDIPRSYAWRESF